jgi:CRISPR-associated protein Cas1
VVAAGDAGCSIVWCGEQGVRFYASGSGDDRRTENLLHQARVWADEAQHMEVVKRLYRMRFDQQLGGHLSLQQIRGMEGVRVREAYARCSRETGVEWTGRKYKRGNWSATDPINRALSAANSCLHALCHSAIAIAGYSESIGFIHTGKTRAFVYDIADLYKVDLTLPLAFKAAASTEDGLESRVRKMCRSAFYQTRFLERVIPDIQRALGQLAEPGNEYSTQDVSDEVLALWDPEDGILVGGKNYAEDDEVDSEIPF